MRRNLPHSLPPSPQAERGNREAECRGEIFSDQHRGLALVAVFLVLCIVSLACWSNDTLFIPPTETPTPTPIPPTPNVAGKFKVGESVTIVGQGLSSVYLTEAPEPETRANRVASASCYPNSTTQIIALEQVKDVTYYQITCTGVSGWVPEAKLKGP